MRGYGVHHSTSHQFIRTIQTNRVVFPQVILTDDEKKNHTERIQAIGRSFRYTEYRDHSSVVIILSSIVSHLLLQSPVTIPHSEEVMCAQHSAGCTHKRCSYVCW